MVLEVNVMDGPDYTFRVPTASGKLSWRETYSYHPEAGLLDCFRLGGVLGQRCGGNQNHNGRGQETPT